MATEQQMAELISQSTTVMRLKFEHDDALEAINPLTERFSEAIAKLVAFNHSIAPGTFSLQEEENAYREAAAALGEDYATSGRFSKFRTAFVTRNMEALAGTSIIQNREDQ